MAFPSTSVAQGIDVKELPRTCVQTLSGHTASVLVVRGNAAGTYCLSGSRDRTVRLWNPYKGTLINSYRGHSGDVRGLAVAADNSTFISAGEDRHINLWDVATSSTIRRMHGHEAAVNDVRHAGTESLLVSASYDSLVAFWDLKGRGTRALQTIKVATDAVTRLAISELGPYVFAASTDGSVTTVDIRKGVLVTDQLHVPVTGIAAPEDGIYVLAACTDSTLRLVDRGSGRVLVSYVGHEHSSFLVECTFLFNGAVAAAGSENGKGGRELHVLVTGIASLEDRVWVLVCTDSARRLVDRGSGRVLAKYMGHEYSSFKVECTFLFNEAVAAAGTENGKIAMWDVMSNEELCQAGGHKGVVSSLAEIKKDNIVRIVSGGADCTIKLWEP